jgi:outer membrane protein assembly factor BamA
MSGHLLQLALVLIVVVNASFADNADSTSKLVIRSIQIEGNNITQPRVILREMSLRVGDTLSHILLRADRDRIYSLGLFNKVTISHIDSADYVDLLISVVERWYIFPYPILSLRTTDVSTLSYGLGVTHQNFLGRDEKLSASYSTGYDRSASFTYQNPRLTDDDDIFLRIAFQYRDAHSLDNSNILFEQVVRMGSGSLGKRVGLFQTLTGTVGYQTWQIPDTSLGRTISPDGTDHFAEIALHYTYDARNIREYPT